MLLIPDFAISSSAASNRPDVSFLLTARLRERWSFVKPGEFQRRGMGNPESGRSQDCLPKPTRGSGVGQSAQEAMTGALKHALERVGNNFSSASVEEILVKEYPWFFLARVTVLPYGLEDHHALLRIKENAETPARPSQQQVPNPATRKR